MDTVPSRVASEFRVELDRVYGRRLRGVFIFGACAREQQRADSDLDVLVVLDEIERYGQEIDRTSEATSRLSIFRGITISRVFVRESDWLLADTPFLRNVRSEAIRV